MTEKKESLSNDSYESEQINLLDSFDFLTEGEFDKEKLYAYLATKPKGIQGISDETEKERLAYMQKHQWNRKIMVISI